MAKPAKKGKERNTKKAKERNAKKGKERNAKKAKERNAWERDRLYRNVKIAQKEEAEAREKLRKAQQKLERWNNLRKDGKSFVVCVVDHNQGYGITFDFMRVYCDNLDIVTSLDKRGITVKQASGAPGDGLVEELLDLDTT